MHGGTYFSHKNIKWMSASLISFCISLYSLTLVTVESSYVDEDKAYELKALLSVKHRVVEMLWGGILLLCLVLTIKEQIDEVVDKTGGIVNVFGMKNEMKKTKTKDT